MNKDRIIRWGFDLALIVANVAQAIDGDLSWTVPMVELARMAWDRYKTG